MADHLAMAAHIGLFGAQVAVGVQLHLEAAVAEDAFGDDGHHVHAVGLRGDDEGRGFVIRVGGGGADTGDEKVFASVPCILRSQLGCLIRLRRPGRRVSAARPG